MLTTLEAKVDNWQAHYRQLRSDIASASVELTNLYVEIGNVKKEHQEWLDKVKKLENRKESIFTEIDNKKEKERKLLVSEKNRWVREEEEHRKILNDAVSQKNNAQAVFDGLVKELKRITGESISVDEAIKSGKVVCESLERNIKKLNEVEKESQQRIRFSESLIKEKEKEVQTVEAKKKLVDKQLTETDRVLQMKMGSIVNFKKNFGKVKAIWINKEKELKVEREKIKEKQDRLDYERSVQHKIISDLIEQQNRESFTLTALREKRIEAEQKTSLVEIRLGQRKKVEEEFKEFMKMVEAEKTKFQQAIELSRLEKSNLENEKNEILTKMKEEKELLFQRINQEERKINTKQEELEQAMAVHENKISVLKSEEQNRTDNLILLNKEKGNVVSVISTLRNNLQQEEINFGKFKDRLEKEAKEILVNLNLQKESQKNKELEFNGLTQEMNRKSKQLTDLEAEIKHKIAISSNFIERLRDIRKQLVVKEKDLSILANRLRNEYEKIGHRAIPIRPIEIPEVPENIK